MKFLAKYIFFVIILLPLTVVGQQGKIVGRVYNATTNEPIPFVNILIWETAIGSTSDFDGKFIFTGLEPGYARLAASAIGYQDYVSEDILVTNAKTITIDLPLVEKTVELKTVEIRASPFRRMEESPVSMRTLDISEVERSPGANRDISKVLQSLPGVASTVAYRNDLIVRGGGPSENRFYLDGIEIPTINHFATQGASGGPNGIINVDLIREVDFYSGAFPANTGNALSSVVGFKLIEPNSEEWNFRFALGAADLAITANGPVSQKSGLVFSYRRSYLQFLFDALGLPFLPTYDDMQFKFTHNFNEKNKLTVIGLGAIDRFKLNTDIENPDDEQRYLLGYLPVNEQWGYTIGANYKRFRKNGYNTLVISRNYLDNRSYKYLDNIEIDSFLTYRYKSTEIENKFRYESLIRKNDFKVVYGTGLEYAEYTNQTFQRSFQSDTAFDIRYKSALGVINYNVFGQMSMPFLNNRLMLSFGVRFDGSGYSQEMADPLKQFSPRFSASYTIRENFYFNTNLGRYYQRPSYTTLGFEDNNGNLVNKQNGLKFIAVDHLVAGIEFLPDDRSKISLEGFYKFYRNYPFSVDDSVALASKGGDFGTFGDEAVISMSKGRTYGFEVLARDKNLGGFNIILSYTFVRSEFTNALNQYIPSSWDNKHILNLVVLKKLKRNWNVGFKWRYVAGGPYTPYDTLKSSKRPAWDSRGRGFSDYDRFNTLRFKGFHQLDIRVDKQYYFKKWSLILYLDIQNLYNFKAEEQDYLTNLDKQGVPVVINPADPYPEQLYQLREIKSESGTILPTLGIIVEF